MQKAIERDERPSVLRLPTFPGPLLGTPLPPLVIGITGHMKIAPDDEPMVRSRLKDVFLWLRDGSLRLISHSENNSQKSDSADNDLPPLGLRQTPILLLTSLAPGADEIAAEVALNLGHQVRCPLAFAPNIYRNASTFVNSRQPEDDTKQRRFDRILERVNNQGNESGLDPSEDPPAFAVHRPEDVELDDAAFEALQREDLLDRERRNLRYRSAGDYISAHCDVLIAICDLIKENDPLVRQADLSELAQPGAGYVVRSHLQGIEPGTLPFGTTLTWADNGPVLRIYCPQQSARDDTESTDSSSVLRTGDISFWHPADSPIPFEFQKEWHARKMNELRDFTARLEKLNQDLLEVGPAAKDQAQALLQGKDPFKPTAFVDDPLKNVRVLWARFVNVLMPETCKKLALEPVALPPLERIAALRRRVADLNRSLDNQVKAKIARAFCAFFTIVIFLQVYDNWFAAGGAAWVPVTRMSLFVITLLIFLVGILRHRTFKRDGLFDRQNDYRAVAEGLRVQFYWNAAGIGRDASRDYLQRARGDFAWIREVIGWAGLPVERHARAFRRLSPHERFERLRDIYKGWIEEQCWYFGKAAFEQTNRHERIQYVGPLLLVAGGVLVLCGFAVNALTGTPSAGTLDYLARLGGVWLLIAWAAFAAVFWLVTDIARGRLFRAWFQLKRPDHLEAPDHWVPLSHYLDTLQTPMFWGLSLFLGWSVFSAVATVAGTGFWPLTASLVAIAKNLVLASGFLVLSWGAVKFAGENSRRYGAMRDMYRAADIKLKTLLDQLEIAAEAGPAHIETFRTLESAIQRYLIELGRESLQENADWLTIHRNKPVEPLIPGG